MTSHLDPPLMSAQHDTTSPTNPNTSGPADQPRGEGVKTVERSTRRSDRKRAWDELSQIDRAVLLEAVRQRREAQEHRRSVLAGLNSSRYLR